MTIILELAIGLGTLAVLLDAFTGFRITRSGFNRLLLKTDSAAKALRDPIADAHVALESVRGKRKELVDLRRDVILNVKTSQGKERNLANEISKYENLARLAGSAGNKEDVMHALSKKKSAENLLTLAQADTKRLSDQENMLESKIKEFTTLLEKAESEKAYLESSIKFNKVSTDVNRVLKDSNGDAISALERLRLDAEQSSYLLEATEAEVSEPLLLEQKYEIKEEISDDDIAKYLNQKEDSKV